MSLLLLLLKVNGSQMLAFPPIDKKAQGTCVGYNIKKALWRC